MLYPAIGIPMLRKGLLSRFGQFKYIRCLQRAGATIQMLVPGAASVDVGEAVSQCDGFLFPGGPDIQPDLYGQAPLPACGEPDAMRDAFELSLLKAVLAAEKPLFCIGRGMQLLNVAYGGTLLQDIRNEQEYQHFDFFHRASATHPVELAPDSLLAKLLEADFISVNSLHHQAVDKIGQGLFPSASSPDGFLEAVEPEGYPFCLAVQWSPQYTAAGTPAQRQLFRAFADACRRQG